MSPELKKLQLEEVRDALDRYRTVIVEAYKVRKWVGRENITEEALNKLNDILEFPDTKNQQGGRFWGQLTSEYRAAPNGFGFVILKAYAETTLHGSSWKARHPEAMKEKGQTREESVQKPAQQLSQPSSPRRIVKRRVVKNPNSQ